MEINKKKIKKFKSTLRILSLKEIKNADDFADALFGNGRKKR